MNIKKINQALFLLVSIVSFNAYSMEQGSGEEKQEELGNVDALMKTAFNIIKGQNNIMAAYNAVYNAIMHSKPAWLKLLSVQNWLFSTLYERFMPKEYMAIPAEQDVLTKALDRVMNNAVYDAIQLIVSENSINKELAFNYFFKWMGFESKEQFLIFLRDELAINKQNKNKNDLLNALFSYVTEHPEVVYHSLPESKEQPIHLFAKNNNVSAMQTLLKMTKKDIPTLINEKNANGDTPLHIVANNKEGETATDFLLKNGADPNSVNTHGETPLHSAAAEGNVAQAKLLFKHGAYLNAPNTDEQNTPLHLAAVEGKIDMVKYLLEAGADPAIVNDDGLTALEYTSDEKIKKTIEEVLEKKEKPKYGKQEEE